MLIYCTMTLWLTCTEACLHWHMGWSFHEAECSCDTEMEKESGEEGHLQNQRETIRTAFTQAYLRSASF